MTRRLRFRLGERVRVRTDQGEYEGLVVYDPAVRLEGDGTTEVAVPSCVTVERHTCLPPDPEQGMTWGPAYGQHIERRSRVWPCELSER